MVNYTVPGMKTGNAEKTIALLQDRLNALNDLALTLKHIHWNVVSPHFIAVHTMLDPQVDAVRLMVDATAERIATLVGRPSGTRGGPHGRSPPGPNRDLGGSPSGTPGALVGDRCWDDYSLGRADAIAHMG